MDEIWLNKKINDYQKKATQAEEYQTINDKPSPVERFQLVPRPVASLAQQLHRKRDISD
jgi:hypothetical protein